MATRSVKLDRDQTEVSKDLSNATKKISGFTEDFRPIVQNIISSPQKYVSAGLLKSESFGSVLSPITDLKNDPVIIRDTFLGGGLELPIEWVDSINDVLVPTRDILSQLRSVIGSVKELLLLLKDLNLSLDDILYKLIEAAIKTLVSFLDLLTPQLGVHIISVPPHIPSIKVLDTATDTKFKQVYDSFLKFNESVIFDGIAGSNEGYITDDLAYSPKEYPTASSAEELRAILKSSLDDKYDYMRPFHSPGLEIASNSGHSAGIILTAGGPLSVVSSVYSTWYSIFGAAKSTVKNSDGLSSPNILSNSYLGVDTTGRHKVEVEFNMSGYTYNPSVKYEYIPYDYYILCYTKLTGDTPTQEELFYWITTTSTSNSGSDLYYENGTSSGYISYISDTFDLPTSDLNSLKGKILQSYFSSYTYPHILNITKEIEEGATVTTYIASRYLKKDETDSVTMYSKSNVILSKPSNYDISSSKANLPNWQGASIGLAPLDKMSEYLKSLILGFKSLFERGVTNPLDGAIDSILATLDLLDSVIIVIDRLVATLQQLANLRLDGYISTYAADKGSRGIKKAVDNHFDSLAESGVDWSNQSTAAIVMLAQADTLQDLQTFIALIEMLFGSPKKSSSVGDAILSSIPATDPVVTQSFLEPIVGQEHLTFDSSMVPSDCGSSPEDI